MKPLRYVVCCTYCGALLDEFFEDELATAVAFPEKTMGEAAAWSHVANGRHHCAKKAASGR